MTKHWFLAALAATIACAALLPYASWTAVWLSPLATAAVFLLNGWSLPLRELHAAAGRLRLLLAIHAVIFLAGFALCLGMSWLLSPWLSPGARTGLIVVGMLPTTITSCVVATRQGGGAVPLAIVVAVASNLLGLVLVPPAALVVVGAGGGADGVAIARLFAVTALPLLVGGMLARWAPPGASAQRSIGPLCQVGLLLALFGPLAKGFHAGPVPWGDLPLALAASVVGFAVLGWLGWRVGLRLGGRGDAVAALFCCGQKTAAVGIPVLVALFHADARALGAACLVLMAWFSLQSVVSGFLAPRLREGA